MIKTKYELREIKYVDLYHFQLWEGKFQDMEQLEMNNLETFIYANVSNFDSSSFEGSEVRVYPQPYEDLYCPEEYELFAIERCYEPDLRKELLENIPKEKEDDPVLCGFVRRHGVKDFSAWSVELSDEDREKIEQILKKYETDGYSERNVYDRKFSDVF